MQSKSLVWLGMVVGGTVGGFIPALWGASAFSFSGVVLSALGAIAGIWAMFKLSR
jgi:hypothetical protein